jgi:hypothetical protein
VGVGHALKLQVPLAGPQAACATAPSTDSRHSSGGLSAYRAGSDEACPMSKGGAQRSMLSSRAS